MLFAKLLKTPSGMPHHRTTHRPARTIQSGPCQLMCTPIGPQVHEGINKTKWMFPKIGVPQNGWFMKENPIKMDDLGVPLFFGNTQINMAWKASSCKKCCCRKMFQMCFFCESGLVKHKNNPKVKEKIRPTFLGDVFHSSW